MKELSTAAELQNSPAIFVLSPPRSGSTLLRVMLGGHPQLFAPPELELLSFNTLAERQATFAERDSFWLEGTLRALMELKECGAEDAKAIMQQCEAQDLTTKEFYALLQGWLGTRVLVDKTPSYALDIEILRRAENDFAGARYLHLVRHPYAMIRSFEEARLDQIFFRHEHNFSRRELAELIWLVSQANILQFLEAVPAERQHQVSFEELVTDPERVLRRVCEFLDLKYVSDMAAPYQGTTKRMVDGIHPSSRMLGDVKFHEHTTVERAPADRWKQQLTSGDVLADETWAMAERFGYPRTEVEAARTVSVSRQELEPIRRVEEGRNVGLPLSFAQQRLWVINQLQPTSSAYNIPIAVKITGRLNVSAVAQSLSELCRRHESLRTTFKIRDGRPVQVIVPAQPFELPDNDLSALAEDERDRETQRLVQVEAQQLFDFVNGPMLSAKLIKLSEDSHVMLLTMHHIVSDGWSMGVLVRELTTLYSAFNQGASSPLSELPLQYVDFAVWQREWLQGEVLESQLAYWKQQLGGSLPVLALPSDHLRPPVRTYRASHETTQISIEINDALKQISQENGATLFMTLLAAFKILLARWSGQEDIVVGTPIAGRNRAELEGLIGFFVNTLVLRTDLSGDPTFTEFLKRVRSVALAAYQFQEFPFEKLVDELKPERDASRTPLFQVMFTFHKAGHQEIDLEGLQFTPLSGESGSAKFELTLVMEESEHGLAASFIYNTDLFDQTTVARLLNCFQVLLQEIVANPDRQISQLALLSPSDRSRIIGQWNETGREYPGGSIGELFEAQVAAAPEAVALVFGAEQVSYGELNRRANQLAHYLRQQGVGAEVLVGVMLERSIELVVSLLGILKAGGAYVPLDPTYPPGRLSFMLEDAGLSILLTQQHLLEKLPAADLKAVCLDADWAEIACLPEANLETETTADNLAYVIYTSGSTGRPKGVLVQHGGVGNLAFAVAEAFEVSAQSRVLQFASISFDASVFEIFKSLLNGATLCLSTAEWLLPVAPLVGLLREQRITMVTLPPSVWAVLPREDLPELRTVISAGEACAAELAASWSGAGRRFVNAYGPTEVTVCATISEAQDGSCKPPIGRPIANTEVYVLDRNQQPVPIGVLGELYVGGVGLARGYRGQPELTAERFVPNPFSTAAGKRLYRTGDLARYWADGNLEYLGRMDQQVKIRGFRIELGEIESVLGQHEEVREVVVLAREDGGGDKRLVAYLVTEVGATADVSQWRAWLSERLPEYMIPAVFVLLAELPMTLNGKVDRGALPAPDGRRPEQGQAYLGARDQLEQMLVEMWKSTLGLEQVGVTDNFFDLGGDSIKGAILINQLQRQLAEYVYVVAIFDAPTVAELAAYLRQHYPAAVNRICGSQGAGTIAQCLGHPGTEIEGSIKGNGKLQRPSRRTNLQWSPLVEIQRGGDRRPLFFVHPVGGNISCYVELARQLGSDQSFYGLQARGLEENDLPLTQISDMASDYVKALQHRQPEGPYLLGGWSLGGLVAYEMAELLRSRGQKISLLALVDSRAPSAKGRQPVGDARALLYNFALDLGLASGDLRFLTNGSFSSYSADQQLERILEVAVTIGKLPPAVDRAQFQRFYNVFKLNAQAVNDYVPQQSAGRLTLFKAMERVPTPNQPEVDGKLTKRFLKRLRLRREDPTLGWAKMVLAVEVHNVPGNHFSLMRQPHLSVLAEKLRASILKAQ